ncbi:aminotransferase class I/II-fold pyridoxal phosphate-dependent enzyme [Haloimpatiens sp. FM7330]|uniref:aminotransferase class I/II-fold pyridoxal phosphate-dependent enzyme n=1 Tax=Haloimpatiens sp. FM7330 TaxID=3298610 RepID=UPI00362EF433
MKINNRLNNIGEYKFKDLNELKQKLMSKGKNIVDLSIGDPDLPVSQHIIDKLIQSFSIDEYNKYPPYDGIKELKKQIIKYYDEVYSVKLNMDEVLILIGSKEGVGKLIPAVCDIGDCVIIPNPAYPVYKNSCYLWGAEPYTVPLKEDKMFLPDLNNIPKNIILKSKLFVINYPNNPTGAAANGDFYTEIIKLCKENNVILCNDGAYNEIIEEKKKPTSILQYDNEKNSIEFGTMSKIYNMTGFRIGYVVGNSKVLKALLKVKTNLDSGQFKPIQYAAIEALKLDRYYINMVRRIYDKRRKAAKKILDNCNIEYFDSYSTFYLWCRTPKEYTTYEFCRELLFKFGLIVTPGYTFGNLGYDYFRIALTNKVEILCDGLGKLKNMK